MKSRFTEEQIINIGKTSDEMAQEEEKLTGTSD